MQSISYELFREFDSQKDLQPFETIVNYIGKCHSLEFDLQCSHCGAAIRHGLKVYKLNHCQCGTYAFVCHLCQKIYPANFEIEVPTYIPPAVAI